MPIYLDNNATTPLDPRVLQAMRPFLEEQFGNASSSSHAFGWQADNAVKKAREQVARLLKCRSADVVFTSGATESNALAILGVVRSFCKPATFENAQAAEGKTKPHIITQATEHKAVLEVCDAAKEFGAEVTILPVNSEGLITPEQVAQALRANTILVSIMMANNEIGTLMPVEEIAKLCRTHNIIFHTDGVQSVGKHPIDLQKQSIDLLSLSGHKMYGPKGVGALIVRQINREFSLKPLLYGGEQERKIRPGTLNVPGIVGLGEACEVAEQVMLEESARLKEWQNNLLRGALSHYPQVKVNGPKQNRLCNNLSLSFPKALPDDLSLGLSGLAYSAGSACNSANPQPSHVLRAIGLSDELSRSTVRLGLGRFTKAEDLTAIEAKLSKMLKKLYPQAAN